MFDSRHIKCVSGDGVEGLLHYTPKESYWFHDLARLNRAIEVATMPEIAAHPFIRRFLDLIETDTALLAIWEWGDHSLLDYIRTPQAAADHELIQEIGQNVGAALKTLHRVDRVHGDVAPNNILWVAGVWKLADLDNCLPANAPIERLPPERYRSPRATTDVPADKEMDWESLDLVLKRLAELPNAPHPPRVSISGR